MSKDLDLERWLAGQLIGTSIGDPAAVARGDAPVDPADEAGEHAGEVLRSGYRQGVSR